MTNFSCWLVQFSKFYLNSIENVWHCNSFVLKFDILYNVNILSFYEVVSSGFVIYSTFCMPILLK